MADPEKGTPVRVLLKEVSRGAQEKEVSLGAQEKEPRQGREGSQARVSSQAKSKRGRGLGRISLPLSCPDPPQARELGFRTPIPQAITYGH